ncbi:nucleotidyltransferase family protein [Francisella hispaniensis]|uniref:nucleotidyltransferase family protein n=1 Tax=Francisella hispaniensis TaxID=622488 RepID=UPI0019051D84|nr:nucleotidyltransferase family protein [Francisella hispaniensis]MBK2357357.1 nucleotidyltransferase family protein [Francisella hispaniensis]
MPSLNYKTDITFQFLLYLIRKHIHKNNQDYVDQFDIQKIELVDFDKLFNLITYHKVELIVLPIIKEINIPKFDYNRLILRAKKIVTKQLLMEKLLSDILSKFAEHKIENVVLKGLPLDKKLYGSQPKRVYKDIDILVKENQLNLVHNILLSIGFDISKHIRYNLEFFEKYPLCKKGIKDLTYVHKSLNIILELHWRITIIDDLKINLNQNFLKKVVYNSKEYMTLTDEYELLYLIYHGGMSGWHRLKWLIDIVDYINLDSIDKQTFLRLITKFRINKLIIDLRFILSELFLVQNNLFTSVLKPRYIFFENYRRSYVLEKLYTTDLSIKELTKKDLFYIFLVTPSKLKFLSTYSIGFFYKNKAIKLLNKI